MNLINYLSLLLFMNFVEINIKIRKDYEFNEMMIIRMITIVFD